MKDLVKFCQTLPDSPKIIREWLAINGVKETPGPGNNPIIMGWIQELGKTFLWIKDDATAWCSIAACIVAKRAGKDVSMITASAMSWTAFGDPVNKDKAVLGDMMVFTRKGGGHIGTLVAISDTSYYIFGGNQGDKVCITRMPKERLHSVRRPKYDIGMPKGCKQYFINDMGEISTNEQ